MFFAKPGDIQAVFLGVAEMMVGLCRTRLADSTWFSGQSSKAQGASNGLAGKCALGITVILATVLRAVDFRVPLLVRNSLSYASFSQGFIGSVGSATTGVVALLAEVISSSSMQLKLGFGFRFAALSAHSHARMVPGGQT